MTGLPQTFTPEQIAEQQQSRMRIMKRQLLHVEAGQWVLAVDDFGGWGFMNDITERLNEIPHRDEYDGGDGWHRWASVQKVTRVCPKTYYYEYFSHYHKEIRERRSSRRNIFAVTNTSAQATALTEKLTKIGDEATDEIDAKVREIATPIRKRAVEKLHKALPHIYGKAS